MRMPAIFYFFITPLSQDIQPPCDVRDPQHVWACDEKSIALCMPAMLFFIETFIIPFK